MVRKKREMLTETIRRKIRECGLTQGELHRRSGVPRETISRFVNGIAGMNLPTLDRLVDALDLELVERSRKKRSK